MKTILVVDPESGSAGIAELFQRSGFRGIDAPNALEAMAKIQRGPTIDMVITDIQLPDMDGLRFLAAIKARRPGLPVIVVTGSSSIESYLHAMNLGVYEYFNKPVPSRKLVRIANIVLAEPRPEQLTHDASYSAGWVNYVALLFRGDR
jgi:DNA-binding NtrC family response regulator